MLEESRPEIQENFEIFGHRATVPPVIAAARKVVALLAAILAASAAVLLVSAAVTVAFGTPRGLWAVAAVIGEVVLFGGVGAWIYTSVAEGPSAARPVIRDRGRAAADGRGSA
jgi:hypothetical protein